MQKLIYCDFDGTITAHDTLDAIADVFGPADWRERYMALRRQGLAIRDTIRQELQWCRATRAQIVDVLRSIDIRPGFEEFLRYVREHRYEFVIQSEGIDLAIQTVLHERGLDDIPFFTNRFVIDQEGRPGTINLYSHPDCHSCGNCKSSHLIDARETGAAVVYIGDGVTDRCPAQITDVLFARGGLAKWAARKHIPFTPFETFHDVLDEFRKDDFEARLLAESRKDAAKKLILPCKDLFEKDDTLHSPRFLMKNPRTKT